MSSRENITFRLCDQRALIEIMQSVDGIVRKYQGTGHGAVLADYCVHAGVQILASSLHGDAATRQAALLTFANGAKDVIELYAADPVWVDPSISSKTLE